MIENRFAITLEGLQETSKRVIRETPRFRKTSIIMPLVIIAAIAIVYFMQTNIPLPLLLLIGLALLAYTVNLLIKTPEKMAVNIFHDMQKKYGEPVTHTRMTEGGILLMDQGEVLAVTMGSRMAPDTFDIHFEKARETVEGAYAAVNCEFARYLRLKYPDAAFLDREDDMGLEGLRKAKLSYNPHHLVGKHWAYLTEDIHGD